MSNNWLELNLTHAKLWESILYNSINIYLQIYVETYLVKLVVSNFQAEELYLLPQ